MGDVCVKVVADDFYFYLGIITCSVKEGYSSPKACVLPSAPIHPPWRGDVAKERVRSVLVSFPPFKGLPPLFLKQFREVSLLLCFFCLSLPWQLWPGIDTDALPSVIVVLSLRLGSHRPRYGSHISQWDKRGLSINLNGIILSYYDCLHKSPAFIRLLFLVS